MRLATLLVLAAVLMCNDACVAAAEADMGFRYFLNVTDPTARCLDGSPGVYLHWPARKAEFSNKWIVWLQGGGICSTPEACIERSKTPLGTSTFVPPTAPGSGLHGALSRNCTINPEFCDYNLVAVMYCDGFLYSGERDAAWQASDDTTLYLRGGAIRRAVFDSLATQTTFASATDVLLVGCSAGAYGTILHMDQMVDHIQTIVPTATNIKAAPFSGLFVVHTNILGQELMLRSVTDFIETANATAGTNPACRAAHPKRFWYMCMMAEGALSVTRVPVFIVNSHTDAWQIPCMLLAAPGGVNQFQCMAAGDYAATQCGSANFSSCSKAQVAPILSYHQAFVNRIVDLNSFRAAGNGAFISSCYTHCEAMFDAYWANVRIGGVSMHDAVLAWWKGANATTPAAAHTHLDCDRPDTAPYQCNPTCPTNTVPFPWADPKPGASHASFGLGSL